MRPKVGYTCERPAHESHPVIYVNPIHSAKIPPHVFLLTNSSTAPRPACGVRSKIFTLQTPFLPSPPSQTPFPACKPPHRSPAYKPPTLQSCLQTPLIAALLTSNPHCSSACKLHHAELPAGLRPES